jgi:hypothetical protein
MQRRQRPIKAEKRKIVILAVWAKGKSNVYDAYEVALS